MQEIDIETLLMRKERKTPLKEYKEKLLYYKNEGNDSVQNIELSKINFLEENELFSLCAAIFCKFYKFILFVIAWNVN